MGKLTKASAFVGLALFLRVALSDIIDPVTGELIARRGSLIFGEQEARIAILVFLFPGAFRNTVRTVLMRRQP